MTTTAARARELFGGRTPAPPAGGNDTTTAARAGGPAPAARQDTDHAAPPPTQGERGRARRAERKQPLRTTPRLQGPWPHAPKEA